MEGMSSVSDWALACLRYLKVSVAIRKVRTPIFPQFRSNSFAGLATNSSWPALRILYYSLLKLWYSLEPCVLEAARRMFRENRRGSNWLLRIDKESMLLFWQWFSRQETEWFQRLGAHWWQRTSAKKRSSLTYVARKTYHAYSRKGIGGEILRWIVVPSQILTLNIARSFDHSNGTRFPITRDSQGRWTPDMAWVRRERWQPKTVVFLTYLKQLRTLKVLLRLLLLCEGYCVY